MTSPEELVEAIRSLARVAHAVDSSPEGRERAVSQIESARAALADGPPRQRWYDVDAVPSAATRASNRELSTFSGKLNPIAPPMLIRSGELADGRPALIGSVRLDRLREGPPHSAHGGVLAGLFDELLGGGQRLNGGPPGMTGRLTVRYRRPTPLDADLELRVWIHDERRRRVTVRGECVLAGDGDGDGDGEAELVTAEAEAIFLRVDFERLSDMMRSRADGETPSPAPPRSRDD